MANPSIEETVQFIQHAHLGQLDKGGDPYWWHPVSVMQLLGPDATEEEKLAALLHDVLEDTATTPDVLLDRGYSDRVVALVEGLSRPEGITYFDWIRQIAASGDKSLIKIKLADNQHNSDPKRLAKLPPEQQSIVRRYERSKAILTEALAKEIP